MAKSKPLSLNVLDEVCPHLLAPPHNRACCCHCVIPEHEIHDQRRWLYSLVKFFIGSA